MTYLIQSKNALVVPTTIKMNIYEIIYRWLSVFTVPFNWIYPVIGVNCLINYENLNKLTGKGGITFIISRFEKWVWESRFTINEEFQRRFSINSARARSSDGTSILESKSRYICTYIHTCTNHICITSIRISKFHIHQIFYKWSLSWLYEVQKKKWTS